MVTLTTHITFSLPIELAERLRFYSKKHDIPISSIIRKSVKDYMGFTPLGET